MKKFAIAAGIALLTELATSWWTWVRAPTDTLRVWYDSFYAYEGERIVTWLIVISALYAFWLLSRKIRFSR
jgi:hypothetical protein